MSVIVVGASSGLGRALAEAFARRGNDLLLVASDQRDLGALGADLALRHGIAIRTLALDLAREPDPGRRILRALDGFAAADALLLPIGYSRADDDFSLAGAEIGELLAINLHAPLSIVHALLPTLLEARGAIVLFGSVAAIRGRGRNVAYAAAKRGLESLYESLRQRHGADGGLRVHLVQLGFLATNLTHGMALPMRAIDPAVVAQSVAARIGRASSRRCMPRRWALLAPVIRALPWRVFRRLRG